MVSDFMQEFRYAIFLIVVKGVLTCTSQQMILKLFETLNIVQTIYLREWQFNEAPAMNETSANNH